MSAGQGYQGVERRKNRDAWPVQPLRRTALAMLAVLYVGFIALFVWAMTPSPAHAATGSRIVIPEASALYRHRIEQAAADVWGVDASPARLAAQIHQESAWRIKARSPVGAQGIAQFMPATAKWIAELFPEQLGQFDPWDPHQAALAAAIYDKWLLDRVQPYGHTRCMAAVAGRLPCAATTAARRG